MRDMEQRIRERAYRIWLEENCPEGRDKVHWDRAKEIVATEPEESTGEELTGSVQSSKLSSSRP
jgi:hypothetical protein